MINKDDRINLILEGHKNKDLTNEGKELIILYDEISKLRHIDSYKRIQDCSLYDIQKYYVKQKSLNSDYNINNLKKDIEEYVFHEKKKNVRMLTDKEIKAINRLNGDVSDKDLKNSLRDCNELAR